MVADELDRPGGAGRLRLHSRRRRCGFCGELRRPDTRRVGGNCDRPCVGPLPFLGGVAGHAANISERFGWQRLRRASLFLLTPGPLLALAVCDRQRGRFLTGRPKVRFRGRTGNILLILNITGFDLARFLIPAGCPIAAESGLVFFLAKVQAIHDGRFRPAGQAPKVSDDRVDFFLPQPPALCFFP
jgi:hypothetical protein